MVYGSEWRSYNLAILLLVTIVQSSEAQLKNEYGVKTSVFLSPKLVMEPGSVSEKYFYDIDFPRRHIALKSFDAEVIDEAGNSVPLHETYLHHWIIVRYYQRKGADIANYHGDLGLHGTDIIVVKNSGLCEQGLVHYFGLGSETRRTPTNVPDPYGIEVGNPEDIPSGYEERWMLNLHAIDTRGAEDRLGCTECKCHLYNVTVNKHGQPLPPDYSGGFLCCYDNTRCRVRQGFQGAKRNVYLKYTVKYVDWSNSVSPVKIYILDVTDVGKSSDESKGIQSRDKCLIEYEVPFCALGVANGNCTHTKSLRLSLPTGGDVIYGAAHQHAGGTGAALYGEGGRVICSSSPQYGQGNEAGNEAGYIVGMSACYPQPGSIKISAGETLTLVSNYSNAQGHTGVMGLFYILVAGSSETKTVLHSQARVHQVMMTPMSIFGIALFGVASAIMVIIFAIPNRMGKEEGYEAIVM